MCSTKTVFALTVFFVFFLHVCVFVVIISAHGSRHAHKHTGAHAASHLHMVKYKRPFKNI